MSLFKEKYVLKYYNFCRDLSSNRIKSNRINLPSYQIAAICDCARGLECPEDRRNGRSCGTFARTEPLQIIYACNVSNSQCFLGYATSVKMLWGEG